MSFFQKLSPAYLPPGAIRKGGLQVHREKIIQTLLIIFSLLGLPSVTLGSIGAEAGGKYALAFVYIGVYFLFLGILVYRRLPYFLRASVMVSVTYLLAVSELFESGQLGEVRMFLVAFVALTAVLFDYRFVIGSILLGVFTIVAASLLTIFSPIPQLPTLLRFSEGTDWVTSTVVFLMLAMMVAGAISLIITSLETNLTEQARLAQKIENERNMLDVRIQERTEVVTRRLVQMRTTAEVSRAISALKDQQILLEQVTQTLKDRFGLYYAGVFLVEEDRQYAELKAGTGEAGQQMIAEGHRLAVGGSSMIGWCIAHRMPRVSLNVGSEAVRFNNPRLPLTRSEIALPIIAHDETLGALTIQSEKVNAFDEDDITSLEGVADSLAVALENARLYQETRQNLDEIRAHNRSYLQRAWSETIQNDGDLSFEFENQAGRDNHSLHTVLVPLTLRDETIGEISLEMDRPDFSEAEETFIENIATQTAIALENARLFENTVRRAEREKKALQITARIRSTNDPGEMMRIAVNELMQALGATRAQIYVRKPGQEIQDNSPRTNGSGPAKSPPDEGAR